MKVDIDGLSLKELKELGTKISKAVVTFEERKRKEALAHLEAAAQKLGFSLFDLTGGKTKKKRGTVAPKYANPKDRSQTWTGRGRRPRWVEEGLKSGMTLDQMKI